jgi:hypothetical protein
MNSLLSGVQACRSVARALAARAMLRTGQGRFDEAWQDLVACHRLGRLVARDSTIIESLLGLAVEKIASKADLAFLGSSKLTLKQLKDCLRDLQNLPPMPDVASKVDVAERFLFLDNVSMVERRGIEYLKSLSRPTPFKDSNTITRSLLDDVDWDPALRNVNRLYDRLAAALRIKDRTARDHKLEEITNELKTLREDLGEASALAQTLKAKETAKERGEVIGDLLMCLMVPAYGLVQQAADRAEQVQANLQIAFALGCYQAEHGRYPMQLNALAPGYLAKIPPDIFSGKPPVYQATTDGYLLYSAGLKGQLKQRQNGSGLPGDGLLIRMPPPELRRGR